MKQFIYASAGVAAPSNTTENKVSLEKVGTSDVYNLVLKRKENGDYIVPIASTGITYIKSDTTGTDTKFTETFTIADVKSGRTYTLIFVKKGLGFNVRSNWTATFRASISDTDTTMAKKIADFVNMNKPELGLSAVASAGSIVFTAVNAGDDFEILGADELFGIVGSDLTSASAVLLDTKSIMALARECAADRGFEYTEDNVYEFYPGMKEDFSSAKNSFTMITIHSTEDRKVGTRKDSVRTVIHVVVPKGDVTKLTGELDKLK